MGWKAWIGLAVVVGLVLGAFGLAIYGGSVKPQQRTYQQVVPNDRLPG